MFFTDDGDPFTSIRPRGVEGMKPVMAMINKRLHSGRWWYGDQWSIVDGYLFWVWWRITGVGFSDEEFPNIRDHALRILERPSVIRAMEREAGYVEQLKSERLYISPR